MYHGKKVSIRIIFLAILSQKRESRREKRIDGLAYHLIGACNLKNKLTQTNKTSEEIRTV
jgi:hypothetical protein